MKRKSGRTTYELMCKYYEENLTQGEFGRLLAEMAPRGINWNTKIKAMLLSEESSQTVARELAQYDCGKLRMVLLYMLGLSRTDMEHCSIYLFHSQGIKAKNKGTVLPLLAGQKEAVLAASVLDVPVSVVLGGEIPAPKEEPPWYFYSELIEDIQNTFKPDMNLNYFGRGKIMLDLPQEIGAAVLWLRSGYTQVTFTVSQYSNSLENWELRLMEFGTILGLKGPSVFVASRAMLHSAPHRLYRMIWPSRQWKNHKHFHLTAKVRALLYLRIFAVGVTEISLYGGPKAQPQTIKYPLWRKGEVINYLREMRITG